MVLSVAVVMLCISVVILKPAHPEWLKSDCELLLDGANAGKITEALTVCPHLAHYCSPLSILSKVNADADSPAVVDHQLLNQAGDRAMIEASGIFNRCLDGRIDAHAERNFRAVVVHLSLAL